MRKLLLISSIIFLISCGPTIQVFSDHDKDVNIQSYNNYGWLDIKEIEAKNNDPRFYNELTDKRIRDAVNKEMGAKGFVLKTSNVQLKLHYHIIIENKSVVATEPVGTRYGAYWEKNRTSVFQYKEGTLIIDLMDANTNQLVWRGWATDVITDKTTKEPEKSINNAVQQIFKKFPW